MPSLEHAQAPLDGLGHAATAIKLGNYAVALSATLAIYLVGVSIYRVWFHPLSKVPGPWWMAVSDLPISFQSNFQGRFAAKARDLHKKYGNSVRVGPNYVIVDGKVGFADIHAHRPGGDATEFKKLPGFAGPDGHLGLIGAPTRDAHRRQRRLLSHAFSDSAMQEQEPIISYYIDLFIKRLSENAAGGKPIDFLAYLSFVTFDIIGDLALGESFGSLENNKYHFWISNLFKGIVGGSKVRFFRFIHPALMPLGLLFDTEGAVKKYIENRKYSDEKAKARMALGAEPPAKNKDTVGVDGKSKMTVRRDFMTYMMAGGKTEGLREEEILSNANAIIVAGSETTATNLSTLFFMLSLPSNRAIRDTAAAEVRSLFQREADVNLRAVSQKALPFLHACIEEALRYHPPAAETPPRVSPGATVDGRYLPNGTVVQVIQIATNHNPENFVEAEYYRPQRFLPKDHPLYDPKFEADNTNAFHPFSHGPRDCIGKNLAYAEMRLIAARILLRFDVELAPGTPENWLEGQRVFIVWEKPPLMLKLTERAGLELKA